ncbi:MAG: hypothetical protein Q8P59_09075, partial [Dehalococcoidia bacterium]|nr:hypothetical protein [Dehalococcoidia bacterium]
MEDALAGKPDMRIFLRLWRGASVAAGSVMLGGLAGWGMASPKGGLVIPALGAGGYMLIALASPPAGLVILMFVAPLSQFAHLDIPLGGGIPDVSFSRLAAGFLVMLLVALHGTGQRAWPRLRAVD